jgi:hypothetical protein
MSSPGPLKRTGLSRSRDRARKASNPEIPIRVADRAGAACSLFRRESPVERGEGPADPPEPLRVSQSGEQAHTALRFGYSRASAELAGHTLGPRLRFLS